MKAMSSLCVRIAMSTVHTRLPLWTPMEMPSKTAWHEKAKIMSNASKMRAKMVRSSSMIASKLLMFSTSHLLTMPLNGVAMLDHIC